MGGAHDILDNDEVEEVLGERDEDLADDHAAAIASKKYHSEEENTKKVINIIFSSRLGQRTVLQEEGDEADDDVDDGDGDRTHQDRDHHGYHERCRTKPCLNILPDRAGLVGDDLVR